MGFLGSLSTSAEMIVIALFVLSFSSSTDAACVGDDLHTCFGDKATCQMYFYYDKGYCPGAGAYAYRSRTMEEVNGDTEAGYVAAPAYVAPAETHGLEKFLCPCKKTLEKYFQKVLKSNSCSPGTTGSHLYTCSTCESECVSSHGYRNLEKEFQPGYGYVDAASISGYSAPAGYGASNYGAPAGYGAAGYAAPAGYGAAGYAAPSYGSYGESCACDSIKKAAIAQFCIDFVGDFKGTGYGVTGHGYRRLENDESYASPYAASRCTEDCVIPCIEYVSDCCVESGSTVCSTGYGPHGGY